MRNGIGKKLESIKIRTKTYSLLLQIMINFSRNYHQLPALIGDNFFTKQACSGMKKITAIVLMLTIFNMAKAQEIKVMEIEKKLQLQ